MDAAIRKAKDSLGTIFDKNLHDLVRGIRNHKENEAKYISECIDEIKQELKQENISVKANAISKLCYLEMLGYDISWAAFNVIEVMSSTRFTYKRIGYLTASQSFHEGTDVLMLTTNMIRKDLSSQNMYEAGIALSGLACFLSHDLARDLANEIMTLMTANKPYIRKKAVLIMYKVFLKYPDALRPSFPRLKEKLDDPDPSVQAAAVNVICELARKNPKNYLSLAPIFFKLMTMSTNNWVLIKIIKLFGALTPLEPRLGQKLIEPLTNLINSTSAMSLLYECINTVLAVLVSISSGQPNHNSAIQICLQKLRILIEDSDQNLKYLGLLAMSKILQTNPKAVQMHKDLIMQCLDDKDESIRLRALDLLYGMVSKKNLMEIIKKLMVHMNKADGSHYRDELLAKIVDICSQNNYQHVTNFEWYVSVLVELTRMEGTRHGKLLSSQMLDVAIRVESIRPFIVSQMAILLDNIHVFATAVHSGGGVIGSAAASSATNAGGSGSGSDGSTSDICEVLYAATWICGEFCAHLDDPLRTMESMLKSKVTNLPGHIQASFVQNVFKLYSHIVNRLYRAGASDDESDEPAPALSRENLGECKRLTQYVADKLQQFEQNADIEVQERACAMLQILKYLQKMLEKTGEAGTEDMELRIDVELASLFEGELNPVAAKAQRKVPVPEGLDLEAWINDPPSDDEEAEAAQQQQQQADNSIFGRNDQRFGSGRPQAYTSLSSSNSYAGGMSSYGDGTGGYGGGSGSQQSTASVGARKMQPELSEEELSKMRESRRQQVESNPFYIKSGGFKKSESNNLIGSSAAGYSSQQNSGSAASIPDSMRSQSIDLKIPLSIPGVASSDSYYRMNQIDNENKKLKKKMKLKAAGKGDKKKKKAAANVDDEEEEEDLPVVKVLKNEMPEGAVEDSDDDDKKKKNVNDPHRALDINLDEPLKEEEKLRAPAHRSANNLPSSKSSEPVEAAEAKSSKKEAKSSSSGKKEKKEKKETKEAKADKKKSSSSSSGKKKNKSTSDNFDLLISTDIPNRSGDDYSELLSPEHEGKNMESNTSGGSEELASTRAPPPEKPSVNNAGSNNNGNGNMDDLDFWLSGNGAAPAQTESEAAPEKSKDKEKKKDKKSKAEKEEKKSSKKDKSGETPAEEKEEKKEKKEKKKDKEKDKEKKHSKKDKENIPVEDAGNYYEDHLTKPNVTAVTNQRFAFQPLASNKHLKMSYSVKPNYMNLNQVIMALRIKHDSGDSSSKGSQVYSIELNLLDASTLKLIRDHLNTSSSDDSIKIPFQLASKAENQMEFLFEVTDASFSKKLKGTLTYMLKDDNGNSVQEKIDFKLQFPCSSFLNPNPCDKDDFVKRLSSGQLNGKHSLKFKPSSQYEDIELTVNKLCSVYSISAVETVDNSASLFTSTMQNHPVCVLIKYLSDGSLSIDGKSTSQSLVEGLLDELKETLTS